MLDQGRLEVLVRFRHEVRSETSGPRKVRVRVRVNVRVNVKVKVKVKVNVKG